MYAVESFRESVLSVTRVLDDLGVRFHLTGGAAIFAYGEPRMTQDFDLVVDRDALLKELAPFCQKLRNLEFLFDEEGIARSVTEGRQTQLLDTRNILKLDLYPRELIPGELSRSRPMRVFGEVELPVVSLIDLAMSKLIWIQKGSHKSRRDLRTMLRAVPLEIRNEVDRLANEQQLQSLLNDVISESDEIDV